MSTDLKIEMFGYRIFANVFYDHGVIESDSRLRNIYKDECTKDRSVVEACDSTFLEVYYVRDSLFMDIYEDEIDFERVKSWKCLSDFYDHVTRECDREDLFGHLSIFDRMFATCTYVVNLCLSVHKDTHIDVLNYGYIIWAMYFDKFSERFYKEGGWYALKTVAFSYLPLSIFFSYFNDKDLRFLKEASINFCQFKMNVKYEERIHISKLWAKFNVMNFDQYITTAWYEKYVNCFEVEILLQDLKNICNCSSYFRADKDKALQESVQETAFCSDTSNLETFDMYESNETIDNAIQRALNCFETWLQGGSSATSDEIGSSSLVDKDESCESIENGSFEEEISDNKTSAVLDKHLIIGLDNLKDANLCSVTETNPENSEETATLDLDEKYKSFVRKNEREYTILKTLERQYDTIEAANTLVTLRNPIEERERSREFPPYNLPKESYLCSDIQVNKSNYPKDISKSPMTSSVSGKTELFNETIKSTDFPSTSRNSANQCKANAIQNTLNSSDNSPVEVEITNECDGKINNDNRLDKLRQEQNDPEMRQFLRMILILGDKQGIQYICRTISMEKKVGKARQ